MTLRCGPAFHSHSESPLRATGSSIWRGIIKASPMVSVLQPRRWKSQTSRKESTSYLQIPEMILVKAFANEETMLRKQCSLEYFPCLHAHATFVAETSFVLFCFVLFFFLACAQIFKRLRGPRKILSFHKNYQIALFVIQ